MLAAGELALVVGRTGEALAFGRHPGVGFEELKLALGGFQGPVWGDMLAI